MNSRYAEIAGTAWRKCGDLFNPAQEQWTVIDRKRAHLHLNHGCKDRIEIAFGPCMQDMKLQPECLGLMTLPEAQGSASYRVRPGRRKWLVMSLDGAVGRIKRGPGNKQLPGPRCLSTSAKDAGHSDTRTAPVSVPNVTRWTMRAGPPACCWLNDWRGVLDLRMEARAEPLGLGIGSPDHRSEHHCGRCQNRRKSNHKALPPFTVRNWRTTYRQYRDFGTYNTDSVRGAGKGFNVIFSCYARSFRIEKKNMLRIIERPRLEARKKRLTK